MVSTPAHCQLNRYVGSLADLHGELLFGVDLVVSPAIASSVVTLSNFIFPSICGNHRLNVGFVFAFVVDDLEMRLAIRGLECAALGVFSWHDGGYGFDEGYKCQ